MFCVVSVINAYTIVDYDEMNYIASGQTQMEAHGWHNESSASSDVFAACNVNGNYLICSGVSAFLHRKFNLVEPTYSINSDNNIKPLNFSIRFKWAKLCGSYSSSTVKRQDIRLSSGYSHTLIPQGFAIQPNLSGKTNYGLEKFDGSFVSLYSVNSTECNVFHDYQIDYNVITLNQASPNLTFNTSTLWTTGTSGLWNSTSLNISGNNQVRYNETYFTWQNGRGFYLDDWSIIVYNEGESYILPNVSLVFGNSSYNCSDGLDNDDDGFIDYPDDLGCSGNDDTIETPFNYHECNDNIDNDNDGFIDYPNDPACVDGFTNNESPKNIYQCNDGIDNDGDGLTDYPNDPRCLNLYGVTESPQDESLQAEDVCNLLENCVFKETIPYTDSIYLHNWIDLTNNNLSNSYFIQGGYSLKLLNYNDSIITNFNLERQFQNSAQNAENLLLNLKLSIEDIGCSILNCTGNNTFYVMLNSETSTNVVLLFEVNTNTDTIDIYNINPDNSLEKITTLTPSFGSFNSNSLIDLSFNLDFNNHTFTYNNENFNFYRNVTPSLFRITSLDYDSNSINTWFHSILLTIPSKQAVCTEFSSPYYLKEDFNSGKLSNCGWTVNKDINVYGEFDIKNEFDEVNIYKSFTKDNKIVNIISQGTTPIFTLAFSEYIDTLSNDGSNTNAIFIQDEKFNVISFLIFDKGIGINGRMFIQSDDQSTLVSDAIQNNIYHNYKIVVNLMTDTQSIYIDNILYLQDAPLKDSQFDFTSAALITMGNFNSQYKIDNIAVYTSDMFGNPSSAIQTTIKKDDNSTYLFGIFYKSRSDCLIDSDCPTGLCGKSYIGGSAKCSIINYKMCDDAGYNRTAWCFVKLVIAKSLEYFRDLILNNFILFLIFLILIMIIIFVFAQFRRR
jgi:hypothetical protein